MRKEKITMNELFSGKGAQARGFENSGVFDCEVVATSDLDKDVIVSYAAIHHGLTNEMIENYEYPITREEMVKQLSEKNIGFDFKKNQKYDWNKVARKKTKEIEKYWLAMILQNNLGDISKIEKLPYADLWFYSFPCQDISVAGKQNGLTKGEATRSGLLWEVERLLVESKHQDELPKYLCLENVKNLVGKKFIEEFEQWVSVLDELGFNTYWKVLNAKNCGIPQNRERVFAFSIRKDVDTGLFDFPIPFDLGVRLKDILEDEVDEKYYLKGDKVDSLIEQLVSKNQLIESVETCDMSINDPNTRDIANCILARYDKGLSNQKSTGTAVIKNNVYQVNNEPKVISDTVYVGNVSNGRSQCGSTYSTEGVSQTICAGTHGYATGNIYYQYRIRKLTPIECFLLMGFTKEDALKCREAGISDSALYKQAGNSIVTDCIKLLAQHLYKAQYDNTYVCYDEVVNELN